jgi:hypothetical protein
MPANTSPDNIQFPTAGDQIAPLNTVFQNLAQTAQTALTNRLAAIAVRAVSTTDGTNLIGSTTFVGLPATPTSVNVTVPGATQFARITLTFLATSNAGTLDVGVAVTGATSAPADRLWNGTAFAIRGAAFIAVFTPTISSHTLVKLMPLTQGVNTITVQARLGGAGGTKQVINPVLTVELI